MVFKNGRGLLVLEHLNLLYLKNELLKWADFLHTDANLGKLEVTLIIIGWTWSKMDHCSFV